MSALKAYETLENLAQELESRGLDIEADGQALSLQIPNVGTLLLTYHGVMQQLWLSSPHSGAHHFKLQDDQWVCTRTGDPLATVLNREIPE